MTVPIVLLLRHRAATVGKRLKDAPPPPRRTTSSKGIALANPHPTLFSVKDSAISSTEASTSSASLMAKAGDNFNGALHCAKAFGIATMLVGAGAMVSVWGIRQYLGVETVSVHAFLSTLLEPTSPSEDSGVCAPHAPGHPFPNAGTVCSHSQASRA